MRALRHELGMSRAPAHLGPVFGPKKCPPKKITSKFNKQAQAELNNSIQFDTQSQFQHDLRALVYPWDGFPTFFASGVRANQAPPLRGSRFGHCLKITCIYIYNHIIVSKTKNESTSSIHKGGVKKLSNDRVKVG